MQFFLYGESSNIWAIFKKYSKLIFTLIILVGGYFCGIDFRFYSEIDSTEFIYFILLTVCCKVNKRKVCCMSCKVLRFQFVIFWNHTISDSFLILFLQRQNISREKHKVNKFNFSQLQIFSCLEYKYLQIFSNL